MSEKNRPLRRDSLETTTSARLAEIVAAAERAASQVIDDAELEARRYLDDARAEADEAVAERISSLVDVTNGLIADAEAIRQRSERLLRGLEQARSQLEADFDEELSRGAPEVPVEEEAERPGRGSHLSAVAPVGEGIEGALDAQPSHESPAGARLLATQMAVSGSSREEIASRLRNGFEIEDTDPILDAILGPED